jgi:hypothetical protein
LLSPAEDLFRTAQALLGLEGLALADALCEFSSDDLDCLFAHGGCLPGDAGCFKRNGGSPDALAYNELPAPVISSAACVPALRVFGFIESGDAGEGVPEFDSLRFPRSFFDCFCGRCEDHREDYFESTGADQVPNMYASEDSFCRYRESTCCFATCDVVGDWTKYRQAIDQKCDCDCTDAGTCEISVAAHIVGFVGLIWLLTP